jgi:hypothetical protein
MHIFRDMFAYTSSNWSFAINVYYHLAGTVLGEKITIPIAKIIPAKVKIKMK